MLARQMVHAEDVILPFTQKRLIVRRFRGG
jgi:hypothetical protein